jgi:hypothetical protein
VATTHPQLLSPAYHGDIGQLCPISAQVAQDSSPGWGATRRAGRREKLKELREQVAKDFPLSPRIRALKQTFTMRALLLASITIACGARVAVADPVGDSPSPAHGFSGPRQGQVMLERPQGLPVVVLRGTSHVTLEAAAVSVEVLSFGDAGSQRVTVARGSVAALEPRSLPKETVSFADPSQKSVTVMRGSAQHDFTADLFAPAQDGEIDRVAFAVEAIESRHGTDSRMWRPELGGPQGPMQVSLAAAIDVGGGDRFDLRQNRLLGRAYLARMFRQYGRWADALAAYNWGPRNVDAWIAAGRPAEGLPLGVTRYVARILHDALIAGEPR